MAETLERQLIRDEGLRLKVYNDHLGKPTIGIGHLVLPKDNLKLGDKISRSRALSFFREDVKSSKRDAQVFVGADTWKKISTDMKNVVTNMAFNLGGPKLGKFKKLKAALRNEDYEEAAKQMKDSAWYNQVPNRAKRLISVVLSEAEKKNKGLVWVEGHKRKDGADVDGFWRKMVK